MTVPIPPDGVSVSPRFDRAGQRIANLVRRTPLVRSPDLSERLQRPVWIKHEELQRTGSFKIRGAANFLTLIRDDPDRDLPGVVACSSGNHGRAVAEIARDLGIPATICVPSWVDPTKLAGIRDTGADVRTDGATYDEAERLALDLASKGGLQFVPPFDHPWIVEGQGTLATEVVQQLNLDDPSAPDGSGGEPRTGGDELDMVVPLSGGGLAAGCFSALDRGRVVAVSAERASVMARSLRAGTPLTDVTERPTIASALSGGIGDPNRVTFSMLRHATTTGRVMLLDASEEAIRRSIRHAAVHLHALVEGGGATALAAFLETNEIRTPTPLQNEKGPLVVVLSGGNLDPERLVDLMS